MRAGGRRGTGLLPTARRETYFAAHQLARVPLRDAYASLIREEQEHDPAEITRRRLGAVLAHAVARVPYYRQRLDLDTESVRRDPYAALARLPLLTREAVRVNFEDLKSDDVDRRRCTLNTTGGSTGEPVVLLQDAEYSAAVVAGLMRNWDMVGRRFGQRAYWLWGSHRDVLAGSKGMKARVGNAITGDRWLNAFHMSTDEAMGWARRIDGGPPSVMCAYAQSAYEFARILERSAVSIQGLSAVITSAGTLHPFMREQIEQRLGARVFNRYGSREFGSIACEVCEAGYLHVFPWSVHLEIVDETGRPVADGRTGEIVVTSLLNHAMPLIRYTIGDRGRMEPGVCRCGWRGQVLREVTGRVVDTFVTADGTLVDGEYFTHLLYFRHWVRKFQVVQRSIESVEFVIALYAGHEPDRADLAAIADGTRAVMGSKCEVAFTYVHDLDRPDSGKFRYTISEVSSPARDSASNGRA